MKPLDRLTPANTVLTRAASNRRCVTLPIMLIVYETMCEWGMQVAGSAEVVAVYGEVNERKLVATMKVMSMCRRDSASRRQR